MSRTRICMIVQDPLTKGGIAAVVNGYRGSSLEERYDVTFIESYRDGTRGRKLVKALSAYRRFIRMILTDRSDLVHIHSSFGPSFYRKLPFIYMASWAGIPVINHIHGADFDGFYTSAGRFKKKLIKKAYGKCSILIALSDEWKERLGQIVPPGRIRVIPNYSIIHEDALENRTGRACGYKILFLGEIGVRKGCHDIPEVAARVCARFPGAEFIIAGDGDAQEVEKLKKEFDEKNVTGVSFPGWVRGEVKDKLLREADVFFLPSYNEGMPMSVLDAMGYGLPVVSTTAGGIPQIVRIGVNGFCAKPGDTGYMAECIIKLFEDDERRIQACKASVDVVREGYSLEEHLRKLYSVYSEVADEKRHGLH